MLHICNGIWLLQIKIASQGEMALMRFLGHKEGDKRFQNHWKTYITEADIAEIGTFPSLN